MTGHEYEQVVARYLRSHGYTGVKVTKGSGDFGVDVLANKGGKKYAVQCKYYSSPVSLSAVQEVFTGMAYYSCDAAMVVTNSTFTQAAKELAKINNVTLIENVTSAGFKFKIPWLKIIALLYLIFIVGPPASLVIESLSTSFTLLNLLNGVGGVVLIALPLWAPWVIKRLYYFLQQKIYVWKMQNGYALVKAPIVETKYIYSQVKNSGVPKKVIRVLSEEETFFVPTIQRKCGVDYSTAVHSIEALEQKNLIEKIDNIYYKWTTTAIFGD